MSLTLSVLIWVAMLPQEKPSDFGMAEFKKLHAELEPQGEKWKSIPWETDLLKAQRMAAKDNKPIFIWSMDGHPLGCT